MNGESIRRSPIRSRSRRSPAFSEDDRRSRGVGRTQVPVSGLGYRHERYRDGAPLTLQEKDALRGIVQRIAALLTLHPSLDELYRQAVVDPWTQESGNRLRTYSSINSTFSAEDVDESP